MLILLLAPNRTKAHIAIHNATDTPVARLRVGAFSLTTLPMLLVHAKPVQAGTGFRVDGTDRIAPPPLGGRGRAAAIERKEERHSVREGRLRISDLHNGQPGRSMSSLPLLSADSHCLARATGRNFIFLRIGHAKDCRLRADNCGQGLRDVGRPHHSGIMRHVPVMSLLLVQRRVSGGLA